MFFLNGTTWAQQSYLKQSNTGVEDRFGFSLALDENGDTLIVGAPTEDSSSIGIGGNETDNLAFQSGSIYVFRRTAEKIWTQQYYVKASTVAIGDGFGRSVAISDQSTISVGAIGAGNGTVFVFDARAVNDDGVTPQNTAISSDVLSNDVFPTIVPDASSLSVVSGPLNGDATVLGTGEISYTPATGFTGMDEYVYQVCDSLSPFVCLRARVNISVTGVPPTAVDDLGSTSSSSLSEIVFNVLTNDILGAQPLNATSLEITSPPNNGSVVLSGAGEVTYTANAGFIGMDVFAYQVCDTSYPVAQCSTASVFAAVTVLVPLAFEASVTGRLYAVSMFC